MGRGSRNPLVSGLPTNFILCLLSPVSRPTSLFLSYQGEQTLISETANPLQQGFDSGPSSILDISQREPTEAALPSSHALTAVSRL